MTRGMKDLAAWQRQTALAKVTRDRLAAEKAGAPVSDAILARHAADYVGAKVDDVLCWMGAL
jgi:hypothetical protein